MGFTRKAQTLTMAAVSLLVIAVACTSVAQPAAPAQKAATPTQNESQQTRLSAVVTESEPSVAAAPEQANAQAPTTAPAHVHGENVDQELRQARINTRGWKTDFTKHSIPLNEILSGGPTKDGIPVIDNPTFVSVAEANEWLQDAEAVQVVEINGDARGYPIQILIWHEGVNDVVGGEPIHVSY